MRLTDVSSPDFFFSLQGDSVQELHFDQPERGLFSWAGLRGGRQGVETEPKCPALLLRR